MTDRRMDNWNWVAYEGGGHVKLYELHVGQTPLDIWLSADRKNEHGYEAHLGYQRNNWKPKRVIAKWEVGRGLETLTHPTTGVITSYAEKTLPKAKDAALRFIVEHRSYIRKVIVEEAILAQTIAMRHQALESTIGTLLGGIKDGDYSPDNYRQGVFIDRLADAPAGLRDFDRRRGRI